MKYTDSDKRFRTTLDQFHTCPHTLARTYFFADVEFGTEQQIRRRREFERNR